MYFICTTIDNKQAYLCEISNKDGSYYTWQQSDDNKPMSNAIYWIKASDAEFELRRLQEAAPEEHPPISIQQHKWAHLL